MMRVGISVCSNGQSRDWKNQNNELFDVLKSLGSEPVLSSHIYAGIDEFSGTDEERAADLMSFYKDDSIKAIYDISGGDLANGVLKYLDFDVIANSGKTFWGYSDLTTVINAIYTAAGKPSVLWQIKNLIYSDAEEQRRRFGEYLKTYSDAEEKKTGFRECRNGDLNGLFDISYRFLQGNRMEGIVIGGNIRCFLKLAGTKYWPDMQNKILLLESLGGESGQIASMFTQLEQIGVFDKVSGVLLGTFTNYEKANLKMTVYDLLKMHIDGKLPVAVTGDIGHGHNSRAIVIGREMTLD